MTVLLHCCKVAMYYPNLLTCFNRSDVRGMYVYCSVADQTYRFRGTTVGYPVHPPISTCVLSAGASSAVFGAESNGGSTRRGTPSSYARSGRFTQSTGRIGLHSLQECVAPSKPLILTDQEITLASRYVSAAGRRVLADQQPTAPQTSQVSRWSRSASWKSEAACSTLSRS